MEEAMNSTQDMQFARRPCIQELSLVQDHCPEVGQGPHLSGSQPPRCLWLPKAPCGSQSVGTAINLSVASQGREKVSAKESTTDERTWK